MFIMSVTFKPMTVFLLKCVLNARLRNVRIFAHSFIYKISIAVIYSKSFRLWLEKFRPSLLCFSAKNPRETGWSVTVDRCSEYKNCLTFIDLIKYFTVFLPPTRPTAIFGVAASSSVTVWLKYRGLLPLLPSKRKCNVLHLLCLESLLRIHSVGCTICAFYQSSTTDFSSNYP